MKRSLHAFFIFTLVFISLSLPAQVTQLSDNTNLETLIPVGNTAILISSTGALWKTDGTAGGTVNYATNVTLSSAGEYYVFGNKLYFSGFDATNGDELWVTDGTQAGTQLVKNINPGTAGSTPSDMVVFNNTLYFFADDGTNGMELWKTNGTDAGTSLVKDINPGPLGSAPNLVNFFILNNELYFTATNALSGTELWKTNGTDAGTVLVKDINPGPGSSDPTSFYQYGSIVLFAATTNASETELWKTDGTTGGTVLVKKFENYFPGFNFFLFTTFKNKVYFNAFDAINGYEGWMTDGTTAGTTLLKDFNAGSDDGFPYFFYALFINNQMIFPAASAAGGYELWSSDGTSANTNLFKEINPGADGSDPIMLLNFTNITTETGFHTNLFKGQMFLSATTATNGNELWKTDGTAGGTVMVKDINPGAGSAIGDNGNPFTYFYTADHLYFSATDGTTGNELWKTDGTSGNTSLVFNINLGGNNSDPTFLGSVNGVFYFTADDGDNANGDRDLFRLDGTFMPLPVKLLTFTGTLVDKTARLNWTTTEEINTDYFSIERSSNGGQFETIGKVPAQKGGADKKDYIFNDVNATRGNSSKVFYRLKMVDADGKFSYSKVIVVNKTDMVNLFTYPNPVVNELKVSVNSGSSKQLALQIFDETGKQVHQQKLNSVNGSSNYQVNVSTFAKGSYYINLVTEKGVETTKFIKN